MQSSLQSIIDDINTYIIQTNVNNDMHTPPLHQRIKHTKGKGKSVVKYKFLPDGVHPHDTIKQKWAHSLLQTISKNRNSDNYEPSSPIRPWKCELSYGVCQLQWMHFPETQLQLYTVYHSEDNWMINV